MKHKKVYILILIHTITFNLIIAQQETLKYNVLHQISVVNENILSSLDSIISFEKNHCNYYEKDLPYGIDIKEISYSMFVIQIESCDINTLQELSPKGYINYHGHYFFFYGILLDKLFRKENKTKIFFYTTDSPILNDDSYTRITYVYSKGNFSFSGLHTFCK